MAPYTIHRWQQRLSVAPRGHQREAQAVLLAMLRRSPGANITELARRRSTHRRISAPAVRAALRGLLVRGLVRVTRGPRNVTHWYVVEEEQRDA